MNDREQLEEWRADRVRRTRQYGGRVQRTNAGEWGWGWGWNKRRNTKKKKKEREARPTCESHYSDSSSNTTFLQE